MQKLRFIYPIIWLLLISYGSLSSSESLSKISLFEHFDKVAHFGMYFGLTILLIPALVRKTKYKRSYIISIVFSILLGLLFEYLQYAFTQGRQFDIFDALFNFIGATTGALIYANFIRKTGIEKLIFKIE